MKTLAAWLALLEQRHPRSIDLGLERCGEVYCRLGSPRPASRVCTIAGTNGKGSTVAYLAALSSSLGQRCGTYTSPHIVAFNERITIMGEAVSDQRLVSAFEQVEVAREGVSLTYFEFTTLAAFLLLQQAGLDCAILEVGLGGRLDTVNLVDADCAVITPIGLDHQDFLGPDIASIAVEKAGIIRAETPLVCTQRHPPWPILQAAADLLAPLYLRGREFDLQATDDGQLEFSLESKAFTLPHPAMAGEHQLDNLAAALAAMAVLYPQHLEQLAGATEAMRNLRVPGRLQQLASAPAIIVDVGHNALAAESVAAWFAASGQTGIICVLAMLEDKPAEAVALALQPAIAHWLCADSPGERGQAAAQLAMRVKSVVLAAEVSAVGTLDTAMDAAVGMAGETGTVLVFGSFTTVSGTISWLQKHNQQAQHDAAKMGNTNG